MTDGETLFLIAGIVTGSAITLISLLIAMRSMKRKDRPGSMPSVGTAL